MSEVPMVEQQPTFLPRKITEQDISTAVKDVVRRAQEEKLSKPPAQTEKEISPAVNTLVESANSIYLSRLKSLVPEWARLASRLTIQKAALTASALSIMISSGCGNVEKQSVPPPPTPTPAVTELLEGMPSSTIKFTPTPEAPAATPVLEQQTLAQTPEPTSTPTQEPKTTPEVKKLEPPDDLFTEKELYERFGIKIFDIKGDIELSFRRGAENDRYFQRLKKQGGTGEAYIVLFNGPYLDPEFLTAEQKAALQDDADIEVLKSLANERFSAKIDAKKFYEEIKPEKIKLYNSLRQDLESKRSVLSKEKYEVRRQALEYQYRPISRRSY